MKRQLLNDGPEPPLPPRLSLTGLIEAGKLRRSRPVLPPASKLREFESSPYAQATDPANTLPPGCTIVNRNIRPADAKTSASNSRPAAHNALLARRMAESSESRVGGETAQLRIAAAEPTVPEKLRRLPSEGQGLPSVSTISVAGGAGQGAREAVADALVGREKDGAASLPRPRSELAQALDSASGGALLGSLASSGGKSAERAAVGAGDEGASPKDCLGFARSGKATTAAAPPPPSPAAAPAHQHGTEARLVEAVVSARLDVVSGKRLPSGVGTEAGMQRPVRYNPGPTVRSARGRKRKAVLDASEVTVSDTVGAEKILALVGDPALQQVRAARSRALHVSIVTVR